MKYLRTLIIFSIFVLGIIACCMFSPVTAFSSSAFDHAIAVVLKHEGGLTNDKADPGGVTDFGISLRYLKNAHIDINGDGKVNAEDVIELTQTEADGIYYHYWWTRFHYDKIHDIDLATKIFDSSVNMGASRAHILVKQALNKIQFNQISVNGDLDYQTIQTLNSVNDKQLLAALRKEEIHFYDDLIREHPSLATFRKGWIARANS